MMPADSRLYAADLAAQMAWRSEADPDRELPWPSLLRMHRRRARLTQEQAGELLGVAGNTVARWEAGQFAPPAAAELPLSQEQVLAVIALEIGGRSVRPNWRNQPPARVPVKGFGRI